MTERTVEQPQPGMSGTADKGGPSESKPGSLGISPGPNWRFVGIVVAAGLVGLLVGVELPAPMAITAALTVFCIGSWATAVVPEHWTALAFFLVAVVSGIAPAQTVFSGFHSSTFWLFLSGMVVGSAIRHTGLGRRAASLLSRGLGKRYRGVIIGIVAFSVALAFVMPSAMGRIVLVIPIIVALADHMGYDGDAKGRIGMLTAGAMGTWLPAFSILPSNAPNMILAGMAGNLYGHQLAYWDYLLLHFPVLGVVKAGVLVALILWMFPDHDPIRSAAPPSHVGPMTAAERRLAVVLGLSLAFWLTDGVHHISPGWVGLAAALYCLWPHSGLTSKKCLNEEINHSSLFFIAGIIGLGAVISATGLGEAVVGALTAHADFSPDRPLWDVAALTVMSTLVAVTTSLPGVPAVMTPIAGHLAEITGLSLTTVLMTQVLAFSNIILPYQAPPLLSAMQMAQLPSGAIAKLCLSLFVITALVLTPLDLLWWHVLGLL